MFITITSILFTSVDLRQLIRKSSNISANPKKCHTNAIVINAHLYINVVTCDVFIVVTFSVTISDTEKCPLLRMY